LNDPLRADMIHAIRTQLLLASPSPAVLTLTSAESGEGRSLVAEALASSFAIDQPTLLIDIDYVNNGGLSTASTPGLAEVLQGSKTLDEVLIKQGAHLTLLPRGKLSGSTLLMLTSSSFATLLQTLRQRYARIIIDTPALSQAQDSQLIARQTDGVVLIAQAERSQASELQAMLETLKREQIHLVGAVLNKVNDNNLESREGDRLIHQHVGELITPVKSR
ncbi:MAG: CpsD/CapB family tyrosine-protein kinase, partial [Enterobacterales bacterium]|nr:CpsD/CapB family tyrosine-protein kinase [Enterobacterales bacterium]